MSELRVALRRLRHRPLFAVVSIATIALGIGGTTAIFSLLYQLLLRPLPYREADRLVFVWNSYPRMDLPQAAVSIPDYLDRIAQAPSIEAATLVTRFATLWFAVVLGAVALWLVRRRIAARADTRTPDAPT